MVSIQQTAQDFLTTRSPFDRLSAPAQQELMRHVELLRYKMGQPILRHESLPTHLYLLLDGQVRLLGYGLNNTQFPVTLQMLSPGALLGHSGLLRDVSCETAIASKESICVRLEAEFFLQLLKTEPNFGAAFLEQLTVAEAYELLCHGLKLNPNTDGIDLREAAIMAQGRGRVAYINSAASARSYQQDRECLWLVSSKTLGELPVGTRLTPELTTTGLVFPEPVRLVGFPLVDFPFLADLPTVDSKGHSDGVAPGNGSGHGGMVLHDPAFAGEIPYAEDDDGSAPSPKATSKQQTAATPRYPLVAAQGVREEAIACFQMLCQYHRIPFRREAVRRALEGRSNTRDSISLQLCGGMAEFIGFNPQLVQVPANKIGLLNTMALVHWQGHLAVIYECSERVVVLGVPGMGDRGLLRLTPQEFSRQVEASVPILLLQVTQETPKERFGLNWFLPYISKYRKGLWEVLIASFFVQLFSLANPLMIQVIIDKVLVQNGVDTLQILGIFLLVIALFEGILTSLRTYLFADITNRIDLALGSEIIDHLLRLPLRYFERRPVGELATRVNELENIRQFLTGTALTVVLDVLFSVIYVVVMFIYSWQLSLVTLATIPFFLALTFIATPILRRLLRSRAERNAETQAHLVEVVSGIQTVKAQNIELRSRWQWQERYSKYVSAGFRTTMTSATAGAGSHFLNQLSGLLVLWVGAYMVLTSEGQFTLGALIAFRIIAGYVTTPLLRLVQLWQNFQETALSLERLSDIVDTPTEAEINRSNIAMPRIQGHVVFDDVCFRFATTGPMQLNNINLDIPAGTFMGIVGQSGSGKSTLLKLLPRLYDPQSGRILIDDYDIAKVELYSLRSQLGLVPQEPLLFDGTVEENISLVVPDATSDEIIEAAKLAVAHDFIMDLPNGYNTRVGERGSALSGGQRQRIAIARTILQNPRLLILDEATSALDYNTERQVCRNIIQAFRGRTVLFITHRLSTIQNADRILVMESSMVAEQGTHAELMGLRGRYFGLYMQQEAQFV